MMRRLIRPTRLMRLIAIGGVLFLTASGGQVFGETQAPASDTTWRLASAQVVTSTVRPPVLKLIASGPIAFQVLPADPSGAPGGPDRVVARLFGVAPGDVAAFGDLAPFVLTVTAAESANATDADTIVTIATGAISATSGQTLVLRAGMKSNEIEAAIVSAQ